MWETDKWKSSEYYDVIGVGLRCWKTRWLQFVMCNTLPLLTLSPWESEPFLNAEFRQKPVQRLVSRRFRDRKTCWMNFFCHCRHREGSAGSCGLVRDWFATNFRQECNRSCGYICVTDAWIFLKLSYYKFISVKPGRRIESAIVTLDAGGLRNLAISNVRMFAQSRDRRWFFLFWCYGLSYLAFSLFIAEFPAVFIE